MIGIRHLILWYGMCIHKLICDLGDFPYSAIKDRDAGNRFFTKRNVVFGSLSYFIPYMLRHKQIAIRSHRLPPLA